MPHWNDTVVCYELLVTDYPLPREWTREALLKNHSTSSQLDDPDCPGPENTFTTILWMQ